IETVSINSRAVSDWNPYAERAALPTVMYDRNNFTFSYTAICFEDYDQVRYRYKLEGLEKDWNPPTTLLEARYTNLKPEVSLRRRCSLQGQLVGI
ncbi:triple tyrosine motif-containing protein, partial [Segatella maculosa]|uniref:triple tyrosine motif-containing protein n=1 Tax=Segatella maculosa TaxID=439703 RepID=UPI00248FDCCA